LAAQRLLLLIRCPIKQEPDRLEGIYAQHHREGAKSLEPVNALRAQAAELAQILEAGTELQAEFRELSKAIGAAVQSERFLAP
jgi:hypothetical protein